MIGLRCLLLGDAAPLALLWAVAARLSNSNDPRMPASYRAAWRTWRFYKTYQVDSNRLIHKSGYKRVFLHQFDGVWKCRKYHRWNQSDVRRSIAGITSCRVTDAWRRNAYPILTHVRVRVVRLAPILPCCGQYFRRWKTSPPKVNAHFTVRLQAKSSGTLRVRKRLHAALSF